MNDNVNPLLKEIFDGFSKIFSPSKTDEQIIAEMREHNKKTMHKILLDRQAEDKIKSVDINETRYDAG